MNPVWIVELGENTNYRIIGIYSSKEKAQLVFDRFENFHKDHEIDVVLRIGKRSINPYIEPIQYGLSLYYVVLGKEGELVCCEEKDFSQFYADKKLKFDKVAQVFRMSLWAVTNEHAVETVEKLRREWVERRYYEGFAFEGSSDPEMEPVC